MAHHHNRHQLQSRAAAPRANSRTQKHASRQRGLALLTVVFALVVLVVLGTVYLIISQNDRAAGRAAAQRNAGDAAVSEVVDMIGEQIAEELIRYHQLRAQSGLTGAQQDEVDRLYWTYPTADRPWLSSWDGWRDDSVAYTNGYHPWNRWPQLSKFGPFVDIRNPLNDLADQSYRNVAIPHNPNDPDSNPNAWGDFNEERANIWTTVLGNTDAKYTRLPITSYDGLTWVAAIRVVDASGMVNVNVASQVYDPGADLSNPNTDVAIGKTPADLDLLGLLARVDRWGASSSAPSGSDLLTNWTANTHGFYASRGLPANSLNTQADRDSFWDNYGNNLGAIYRGQSNLRAFGSASEWALLFGTQSRGSDLFRGLFGTNPYGSTSFSADDYVDDPRYYLTTFNGERLLNVATVGSRTEMPPWIDRLDGEEGYSHTFSNANPLPYYKLDPNALSGSQLALAFQAILSTGGNPYGGTNQAATDTAGSLAANLLAYRNATTSDIGLASVTDGPRTYYGMERQPFMVEVMTLAVRQDRADGEGDPQDADFLITAEEPVERYILVELRNPFDADINLSEYYLKVDQADPVRLSGTLKAKSIMVLYSNAQGSPSNDREGQLRTLAEDLAGNFPGTGNAGDHVRAVNINDWGDGEFLLIYRAGGNDVVIDRIRPSNDDDDDWPAEAPNDNTNVGSDEGIATAAAALRRDTRANRFFGFESGGLPNYIYERPASNVVAVAGTAGAPATQGDPGANTALLTGNADPSQIGEETKDAELDGNNWPAPQQLIIKNDDLEDIGEIALLPTVCHWHEATPDNSKTFSELMAERYFLMKNVAGNRPNTSLTIVGNGRHFEQNAGGSEAEQLEWSRYAAAMARAGRLRYTEYIRTAEPRLPVAMMIFDAFDIVAAELPGDRNLLPGRLNLNTARARSFDALPYWSDQTRGSIAGPGDAAKAYRERADVSPGMDMSGANGREAVNGFDTSLRDERGYRSIGELLALQALPPATGGRATRVEPAINLSAIDFTDTEIHRAADRTENSQNLLPAYNLPNDILSNRLMDETRNDTAVDDMEEQVLLFRKAANLVTLRSDVFIAGVRLKGLWYDREENRWRVATERYFYVMYDRSNVKEPGDRPAVLWMVERR